MTTADTSVDHAWGQLADADEDERQAQIRERYAMLLTLSEDERRERLRAMAQAEYALPDDDLRRFTISRLRVLMSMDPDAARTITTSNDAVMQRMPGPMAMRRVALIQTLAREFSPEEEQQLRAIIPGVFGDQAKVVRPSESAAQAVAATAGGKKPWWAFWRKK